VNYANVKIPMTAAAAPIAAGCARSLAPDPSNLRSSCCLSLSALCSLLGLWYHTVRHLCSSLPPLPADLDFSEDGQTVLPARVGQIIQVSKEHPDKLWLYGNVLYDPANAVPGTDGASGRSANTSAAPSSGWSVVGRTKPSPPRRPIFGTTSLLYMPTATLYVPMPTVDGVGSRRPSPPRRPRRTCKSSPARWAPVASRSSSRPGPAARARAQAAPGALC
jgi:hypothetical protein